MNMYQTTSNYHYYNQHNLLISPSSASSIYSGQLINDDHFYANFDNANNSLIHMFINNNEQRLEQTMADQFYPNSSSSAFTFSSPSPSSSYNSSNGSGKMIMNWTPGSQDEPVVLCELDEITKSLNNQMVEVNEKKCKMIQNLDLSYNQSNASLPSVQTQIEQVDQLTLTSYDFNSNSIITRKLNETNLYNSIPHHPISEPLLIQQHQQQQQFNGVDLIQQSIQPSIDSGNCISNFTSLSTTNSPVSHPTINNAIPSTIKSSSLVSKSVLSSIQSNGLTGNLANSGLSSSSPIQTELNQLISSNNQLFANQATNQFQINQLNGSKTGQETTTNSTNQTMNNNHLLNAIIGYDSEGRPIRNTANKKERRRTLSINNAFSNLRDCIPNVPADTKLSKIKTLRLATSYISYLMELLDDSAPSNSKRRLMMTCEDFKVDLQRFKGRSKNSIHLIYPSKFTVSLFKF